LEYGDYQCAYCGAAYSVVKRIQKEFGDDLRLVFRNFPISSAHPYAMAAALAAEAASTQGSFWQMHDLLYERQDRLDSDSLLERARSLDLDIVRFKRDISNPETAEKVSRDLYGGMRSGVRGTPGFFINGIRYDGDWSHLALRAALNDVLSRSGKVSRAG
jgi:protein-disulfide isomerase